MKRRLDSWLDSWMEYYAGVATPPLFKKWAGIATIAAALERKVWVYVPAYKSNLYPNLYTFFVGPPAVGKTVMTSKVREMLQELSDHKLAPVAVSRGSLMDSLRDAHRTVMSKDRPVSFNSLTVIVNELQVFLTEYQPDFMSTITDIYDCKSYGEKKRGKELEYVLNAPQLNILAATAPASLQDLLPDNAYEHGFMSRVVVVYSDASRTLDLFDEVAEDTALHVNLVHDLKLIGNLFGACTFTDEAKIKLNAWHKSGGKPRPEHPRLRNYNSRRTAHTMKLCMIANAQRCGDLIITVEDFMLAQDWLAECEAEMENVFVAMKSGSERAIMIDCAHMARRLFEKTSKPIREAVIIEFLQTRGIPSHSVERLLKLMIQAEMFEKRIDGLYPNKIKSE